MMAKNILLHKSVLVYVQIPWHFLVAPFFYMFLVHYLGIASKTIKLLRIIIPVFLIVVLLQLSFVFVYQHILSGKELQLIFEKYTSTEEMVSFMVSISIFLYSYFILKRKEKLYTTLMSFDKLKWVYTFFTLGAICYLLWVSALVVKVYMDFSGFLFSYYPLRIATTILIFWMGYQAIVQLQVLKERRSLRAALTLEETKEQLFEEDTKVNLEFLTIKKYILLHKKITDPTLSRDLLAKEINMGKNKLSSIVNQATQKTFTEYINELRVDLVKRLLKDEKYKDYTITSIGLECGFSSKSTFYSVFKKYTGKTPLQFKNENK